MPTDPFDELRKTHNVIELKKNVYTISSNWFVNSHPLISRIPRVGIAQIVFRMGRTAINQYCQTFEAAYLGNPYYDGYHFPVEPIKMGALRKLYAMMEWSCLYGIGIDPAMGTEPKQIGLRNLLEVITVNTDRYTFDDFKDSRIFISKPDVLLISEDFADGFAIWGGPLHRIDAGISAYGRPIDVWESDLFPRVTIIVDPALNAGTAVALVSGDVRFRCKREEYLDPDAARAEGGIEIDRPDRGAWIEGVTGFAQ